MLALSARTSEATTERKSASSRCCAMRSCTEMWSESTVKKPAETPGRTARRSARMRSPTRPFTTCSTAPARSAQ